MPEGLQGLHEELDALGLTGHEPEALAVFREWAPQLSTRFPDPNERSDFLELVCGLLTDSPRDPDSAHFWLVIFRMVVDEQLNGRNRGSARLMRGIGYVATDENVEELFAMTAHPRYLTDMYEAVEPYFIRSQSPLVPEVMRRLFDPAVAPGSTAMAQYAPLMADRGMVELVPELEAALASARQDGRSPDAAETIQAALNHLRDVDVSTVDVERFIAEMNGDDLARTYYLKELTAELDARGLTLADPRSLAVMREWAPDLQTRLRAYERESFLRHVGSLLERSEKDADAAHFWIGVFRTAIDENPHRPLTGPWYLMLGIAHIATEENFEELAELTESPSYLPDMINAYDVYFVKSKHPLVPELLRRLMEPEDLYHPGQIAYGATLAANRKFVQLIPTIEKLQERLSREEPAHPTIAKVDDALYRLRRAEYVQDTRSADSDVLLVDLEAGDLQRVAFAANALGARKVVAALPRLRELMESDDLPVRREAKLAVTKLEKAQAS